MLIVRYGEIGLKGKNRRFFEETLAKNIERKLKRYGFTSSTKILRGRIFVFASDEAAGIVAKCPGVVSVSPAREMKYEEVKEYLLRELEDFNPASFRVSAHRVDKKFSMTSQEINEDIGAFIVENFGWRVNLDSPDLVVGIEIINGRAYVFFESYRGVGGLPVGTAGKLLLLLSPGMDSPVAGYMMLRRGAKIVALHFSQGPVGEEKVKRYVRKLSEYAPKDIEINIVPHEKILGKYAEKLKKIKREEWTCVLCKYLMLKEASEFAERIGALGIVTGDSLGQVASQTLHNMMLESRASKLPIYRPLIGMDKVEIESIAKEIGTYDIFLSAKEEECPFRPRHVITVSSEARFENVLKRIGL